MGRRRDSVPVRLPGDLWRSRDGHDGGSSDEREVALRLAVSRQGLGLELGRPVALGGGVRVDEVVMSLPHLRFPVDLSGGVPRFRHCRGRLERLSLVLERGPLSAWAPAALDGLLGEGKPSVSVMPLGGGISLGLAVEERAVAWELRWAPLGRDLCLVVGGARAQGVEAPALMLALRASERLLAGWARRKGAIFRVDEAPRRLLQEVLPRAGARLPSTEGVVWSRVEAQAESLRLLAEQGGSPAEVGAEAVRALEEAELLVRGDEALGEGELERAREAYLEALERAPRQREIVVRLADLDRAEGGRVEAALSTLVSAVAAVDGGALGASLLAAVGDREGARVAYERAAAAEPHPPLAALCLVEAAALAEHLGERAALLSAAVVRAPSLRLARWRRLSVLLSLGDGRGALAEVEHLEALTSGAGARVEVLLRAGRMLLERGMAEQASAVFERALRGRPASEEGLVGLAEAMFQAGDAARAADVLGRVIALSEARGRRSHGAALLLARVLAEGLHELPLAIARARSIPIDAPEALPARHVEARSLAQLGDRTGASVAYASLRDAAEHGRAAEPVEVASWLAEAARFEQEERGDLAAAKRHLGVALRLRPRDPALLAAFRRVAEAHEQELLAARPLRGSLASPAAQEPPYAAVAAPTPPAAAPAPLAASPTPLAASPTLPAASPAPLAASPAPPAASPAPPAASPAPLVVLPAASVEALGLPTAHAPGAEQVLPPLAPPPRPAPSPEPPRVAALAQPPAEARPQLPQVAPQPPQAAAPQPPQAPAPQPAPQPPQPAPPAQPEAAAAPPPEPPAESAEDEDTGGTMPPPAFERRQPMVSFDVEEISGNGEDEARADVLAERVRADPTNLEVVLELAGVLERLNRNLDLFALLSARLEEGDETTREVLLPLQRAVLRRLIDEARREGRESEASLYEQMLQMFS